MYTVRKLLIQMFSYHETLAHIDVCKKNINNILGMKYNQSSIRIKQILTFPDEHKIKTGLLLSLNVKKDFIIPIVVFGYKENLFIYLFIVILLKGCNNI